MSNDIDFALSLNSEGIYDISIGDDGDVEKTKGLDAAILMSVLCEVRAESSEITRPDYRKGSWQNSLNDVDGYEIGSKLFLVYSARATQESIDLGIDYINAGLNWMISDNILKSVVTTGELTNRGILFTSTLTTPTDKVEKKLFEVFEQTRTI